MRIVRTANKQKPTDQVGSGHTLPPRSTAVGVISLSAVWGNSFPTTSTSTNLSYKQAHACCVAITQVCPPGSRVWRNLRFTTSAGFEVSQPS